MDEPPARAFVRIGRFVENVVDDAVEDHERRCHIPPPRRGPLTAIPWAGRRLDDSQVSRAMEMLESGATEQDVLLALDVPRSLLHRALAEYRPAWHQFLAEREAGQ